MMKPIVTITMNHVCPMVTGLVPHIGGAIIGPGNKNVLINSVPVSVMGDKCVCSGPPDVIIQGHPTVLINNVPVVVQGSMTAHGGTIPMGDMTVMVGSSSPTATVPVMMDVRDFSFPKIKFADKVAAFLSGNLGTLRVAQKNIRELKKDADSQDIKSRIIDAYWIDGNGEKQRSLDLDAPVTLYVVVEDAEEGKLINLTFEDIRGESVTEINIEGTVDSKGIIKIENFMLDNKNE